MNKGDDDRDTGWSDFRHNLVSVWIKKRIKETDENSRSPSRLLDTVSAIPGVSDFTNERPGNVFLKRLKTLNRLLLTFREC